MHFKCQREKQEREGQNLFQEMWLKKPCLMNFFFNLKKRKKDFYIIHSSLSGNTAKSHSENLRVKYKNINFLAEWIEQACIIKRHFIWKNNNNN